jgi:hypothetical protein
MLHRNDRPCMRAMNTYALPRSRQNIVTMIP